MKKLGYFCFSDMSEATYPDEVPLQIPAPLTTLLENDCIEIIQRRKLVKLPVNPSIETILKNYFTYCITHANEDTNLSLLNEVLDGIKIYFDFTLKDHLLYSEEKEQYDHVIQQVHHVTSNCVDMEDKPANGDLEIKERRNSVPPSSIYGAIHLLRLFVKMPLFLSRAKFPPIQVHLLHQHFKDILSYLSSHLDTLFSTEYRISV